MFNAAREHYLPELNVTGAEGAGAGVQIIAEHPFETFRIVIGNFRPAGEKTLIPGHQGGVIIGAEVMPVFHHKVLLAGIGDLPNRRQTAVGEDIFIDPRVDVMVGDFGTDGVQ